MAAHRSRDGCAARHEGAGAPVRIVSSTGADGAGAALVLPLAGADFPGTGIGLTTCERIVRRHGGSIRGEGRPDEGAVFYVELGAAPPPEG